MTSNYGPNTVNILIDCLKLYKCIIVPNATHKINKPKATILKLTSTKGELKKGELKKVSSPRHAHFIFEFPSWPLVFDFLVVLNATANKSQHHAQRQHTVNRVLGKHIPRPSCCCCCLSSRCLQVVCTLIANTW